MCNYESEESVSCAKAPWLISSLAVASIDDDDRNRVDESDSDRVVYVQ